MEQLQSIFQQHKTIILVIVGFLVIYFISMFFYMKRLKKRSVDFTVEHPDAAKLYLVQKAVALTEPASVYFVNNEAPVTFMDGTKSGVYLLPGANIINAAYSYSRPGVVHKTVTKTYGPQDLHVETEPNKSYHLTFDRKTEQFEFNEL